MTTLNVVHLAWLALAIVLEIVANIALKYANGFRRPLYGVISLVAVLAAFSALSQAVKGIDPLRWPTPCGAVSVWWLP